MFVSERFGFLHQEIAASVRFERPTFPARADVSHMLKMLLGVEMDFAINDAVPCPHLGPHLMLLCCFVIIMFIITITTIIIIMIIIITVIIMIIFLMIIIITMIIIIIIIIISVIIIISMIIIIDIVMIITMMYFIIIIIIYFYYYFRARRIMKHLKKQRGSGAASQLPTHSITCSPNLLSSMLLGGRGRIFGKTVI